WMIAYVLVSQVGLMALSQVGTHTGGWAIFNNAWLLLQLPYGVIGYSVMTAILPRMSSAAADGDGEGLIADLSLGNRLSTVIVKTLVASIVGSAVAWMVLNGIRVAVGRGGPLTAWL